MVIRVRSLMRRIQRTVERILVPSLLLLFPQQLKLQLLLLQLLSHLQLFLQPFFPLLNPQPPSLRSSLQRPKRLLLLFQPFCLLRRNYQLFLLLPSLQLKRQPLFLQQLFPLPPFHPPKSPPPSLLLLNCPPLFPRALPTVSAGAHDPCPTTERASSLTATSAMRRV